MTPAEQVVVAREAFYKAARACLEWLDAHETSAHDWSDYNALEANRWATYRALLVAEARLDATTEKACPTCGSLTRVAVQPACQGQVDPWHDATGSGGEPDRRGENGEWCR